MLGKAIVSSRLYPCSFWTAGGLVLASKRSCRFIATQSGNASAESSSSAISQRVSKLGGTQKVESLFPRWKPDSVGAFITPKAFRKRNLVLGELQPGQTDVGFDYVVYGMMDFRHRPIKDHTYILR